MGRGQQRSMGVCRGGEKGKGHMDAELVRSMARQRRVVCVALCTALITFASYVVYIKSGIRSEELAADTTFLDGSLVETPPLTEREAPSPAETFLNVSSGMEAQVSPSPSEVLEEDKPVLEDASPSVIASTSPENSTAGECDLKQGEWVPDLRRPLYNSSTCRYIQAFQNCAKNGRPDESYLFWKWKPEQCEVPRIDAAAFLAAMRDRLVVFAGDSIARNQFQSLLCILSQVEDPKNVYHTEDGRNHIYLFESYNFTLKIHWAPYLVRVEDKLFTWPDRNVTEMVTHVYLDELAEVWVKAAVGADILHLSAGQWWYKKGIYLEKGEPVGCHTHPACFNEIGFARPYGTAIANVLKRSLSIPGFNGTTVYRSFAPDHFEYGTYDTGGLCNRTTPGGVPRSHLTDLMYTAQIKHFQNVTEELDEVARSRLKVLDITNLSQIRADAHPNGYRTEHGKLTDKTADDAPNDCLHWCLPGPIDTWNDLLVESVRNVIFK